MVWKHVKITSFVLLYFQLIAANEKLEVDNRTLTAASAFSGMENLGAGSSSSLPAKQDELRRLQAQNSVLQEALSGT